MSYIIKFLLFFYALKTYSQIFINELYPAPLKNQSEWIELVNPSETEITLDGIIVSNRTTRLIIKQTVSLQPQSFLILLKDTNQIQSYLSCDYIVCNLPTLHNDWDAISIYSLDSNLIDSVFYTSKLIKQGFSIERLDVREPGYNMNNWKISSDTTGNTICRDNSNRIMDFRLIKKVDFLNGDCILTLKNLGASTIPKLQILAKLIFKNNDQDFEETFFENKSTNLLKYDSLAVVIPLGKKFLDMKYQLLKSLTIELDYDSLNLKSKSILTYDLSLPKQFSGIQINEFLFDVYTGCGEFIELANTTFDTININGWKIVNSAGKRIELQIKEEILSIPPNSYFVVFWDSTFFNCFEEKLGSRNFFYSNKSFNLRNTGDQIILINSIGLTHDSLTYFPQWHKGKFTSYKQKSLEKLVPTQLSFLPDHWYTCVDQRGATPGEINSVSLEKSDKITLLVEPEPFSPSSNSHLTITYILPFQQARITAKIFDLEGIEISTIANNQISPSYGQLIWNGNTSFGDKIKAGGYVFLIEANDIVTGELVITKRTIAVGW